MQFKKIGVVGHVVIKCGVVGLRRVVSLSTATRGHMLSMNVTAVKELITHLRSALRELERLGLDEPVEKVKPGKRS